MEECLNDEYDDEKRKTVANKNEGVIHIDNAENENETTWDNLEKVIE